MITVLDKIERAHIRYYPYPHIVIENCLPTDLYKKLSSEYPTDEQIHRANAKSGGKIGGIEYKIGANTRNDLPASVVYAEPSVVSDTWAQFVKNHTSQAFFQKLVRILGPEIKTIYPNFERRASASLEDMKTGVRFDPKTDHAPVSLDCQISINTPSAKRSSVRGVHTDGIDELYAMLLYFRRPDDKTEGGNLEIHRWKDNVPRLFQGEAVDESDSECVGIVPYKPNTLVIFINSEFSLHAVSPRDPSNISRRLVNIIGRVYNSVPDGLFVKKQKPFPERLVYKVKNRLANL